MLATLHRNNGARFGVLKHALGVSGESLRACLQALIANGWVTRNPGYGHPLRPEYVLTPRGGPLARASAAFDDVVRRCGGGELVYRKWSVPLLVTLRGGVLRFTEIEARLPVISPRALTQGLDTLCGAEWVERPEPGTDYGLTPSGLVLARAGTPLVVSHAPR